MLIAERSALGESSEMLGAGPPDNSVCLLVEPDSKPSISGLRLSRGGLWWVLVVVIDVRYIGDRGDTGVDLEALCGVRSVPAASAFIPYGGRPDQY